MFISGRPTYQQHTKRKEQPRIITARRIGQPPEQKDRKKDKSQSGKEIDRPVIQYNFQIGKAHDSRFNQRQTISHIIEQVIKLIADIKQCQPDISQ